MFFLIFLPCEILAPNTNCPDSTSSEMIVQFYSSFDCFSHINREELERKEFFNQSVVIKILTLLGRGNTITSLLGNSIYCSIMNDNSKSSYIEVFLKLFWNTILDIGVLEYFTDFLCLNSDPNILEQYIKDLAPIHYGTLLPNMFEGLIMAQFNIRPLIKLNIASEYVYLYIKEDNVEVMSYKPSTGTKYIKTTFKRCIFLTEEEGGVVLYVKYPKYPKWYFKISKEGYTFSPLKGQIPFAIFYYF